MTTEVWQRGSKPFDPEMLLGRKCVAGVDLSRKGDIAAVVLVFPLDGGCYLLPRLFLPGDNLKQRKLHDHASYADWVRQGLLTLTPGEVIDYRMIRERIKDDAERYAIREIGFLAVAQASLVFTSSSNSSQAVERFDFDGIEFRGITVVPDPSALEICAICIVMALSWAMSRRASLWFDGIARV